LCIRHGAKIKCKQYSISEGCTNQARARKGRACKRHEAQDKHAAANDALIKPSEPITRNDVTCSSDENLRWPPRLSATADKRQRPLPLLRC